MIVREKRADSVDTEGERRSWKAVIGVDVTSECQDGNEERKMERCKPRATGCYEESQWQFVETGVLLYLRWRGRQDRRCEKM